MSRLVYCATPSRLVHKKEEIMRFASRQGYAPLHPFQALPYDFFEGNLEIGRTQTLDYCLRLVAICDLFWIFGISQGTLDELVHAHDIKKPVQSFVAEFDPEWKHYYQLFADHYRDALDKLVLT